MYCMYFECFSFHGHAQSVRQHCAGLVGGLGQTVGLCCLCNGKWGSKYSAYLKFVLFLKQWHIVLQQNNLIYITIKSLVIGNCLQGNRNDRKCFTACNVANPMAMMQASCLLLDHLKLHGYLSLSQAILSTVTETGVITLYLHIL